MKVGASNLYRTGSEFDPSESTSDNVVSGSDSVGGHEGGCVKFFGCRPHILGLSIDEERERHAIDINIGAWSRYSVVRVKKYAIT